MTRILTSLSFLGPLPLLHRLVVRQAVARRGHRLQDFDPRQGLQVGTRQTDPRTKLARRVGRIL